MGGLCKVVELAGGGSFINGATLTSLTNSCFSNKAFTLLKYMFTCLSSQ